MKGSFLKLKMYFVFETMTIHDSLCVGMYAVACRYWKMALDLELEARAVVSHLSCRPGTELRFSARAAPTPSC